MNKNEKRYNQGILQDTLKMNFISGVEEFSNQLLNVLKDRWFGQDSVMIAQVNFSIQTVTEVDTLQAPNIDDIGWQTEQGCDP